MCRGLKSEVVDDAGQDEFQSVESALLDVGAPADDMQEFGDVDYNIVQNQYPYMQENTISIFMIRYIYLLVVLRLMNYSDL